jgi:hypothetical protein
MGATAQNRKKSIDCCNYGRERKRVSRVPMICETMGVLRLRVPVVQRSRHDHGDLYQRDECLYLQC